MVVGHQVEYPRPITFAAALEIYLPYVTGQLRPEP
jgi:hypothetical protein